MKAAISTWLAWARVLRDIHALVYPFRKNPDCIAAIDRE